MNKYLVTIYFSDADQYEVDAENEDEAEEIARNLLRKDDFGYLDIDSTEVEFMYTNEEEEE